MTNIEKYLIDANAYVLSKGPGYVQYVIDGAEVVVRPASRTWSIYPDQLIFMTIASGHSRDQAQKLLSTYKKSIRKMEELFDALQSLEDPWGEAK